MRRVVDLKTPTRDGAAYDAEAVPAEWQTWLRFARVDPPTHEELEASVRRRAAVQVRAQHSALAHEQAKALLQAEHARLHAAALANAAPAPDAAALPGAGRTCVRVLSRGAAGADGGPHGWAFRREQRRPSRPVRARRSGQGCGSRELQAAAARAAASDI